VRLRAIGNTGLHALQAPAVSVRRRLDCWPQRVAAAGFLERRGQQDLARHDTRQECRALGGAAEFLHGECTQDEGGEQRHRGERATLLFEHQAELAEPEARATVLRRNCTAKEARFRKRHPQRPVMGLTRAGELTAEIIRHPIAEDLRGELAQSLLFLAVTEFQRSPPQPA